MLFLQQRNIFLRAKYYGSPRLPFFLPPLSSCVGLVVLQVRIVVLRFGISRRFVRRGLGTGRARSRPLLRATRPAPSATLTAEREKGREGGGEVPRYQHKRKENGWAGRATAGTFHGTAQRGRKRVRAPVAANANLEQHSQW